MHLTLQPTHKNTHTMCVAQSDCFSRSAEWPNRYQPFLLAACKTKCIPKQWQVNIHRVLLHSFRQIKILPKYLWKTLDEQNSEVWNIKHLSTFVFTFLILMCCRTCYHVIPAHLWKCYIKAEQQLYLISFFIGSRIILITHTVLFVAACILLCCMCIYVN